MKRFLAAALSAFVAKATFAMPSDQPYIRFYSNGDVSVGMIYSPGTLSTVAKNRRRLQEVYVCKDEKRIADFTEFTTTVVAEGTFFHAKSDLPFAEVSFDFTQSNVGMWSVDTTDLKLGTNTDTLHFVRAGVISEEIRLNDPCHPIED